MTEMVFILEEKEEEKHQIENQHLKEKVIYI